MRMASIHYHFANTEALKSALDDSEPQQFTHELERRFNPTELFVGGLSDRLTPLRATHAGDAASLSASLKRLEQIFRAGVTD